MGGGGSSFQKKEIVDPKPIGERNGGISVATSSGCDSCVLTFDLGSTTSLVTATRIPDNNTSLGNRIQLTGSTPLSLTFNGRHASFTQLFLYYPAPIQVEGIQADAVFQAVDPDNIMLFIPLKSSGSGKDFLEAISARLDMTPDGLGIPDPTTKKYKEISIPTGDAWSLTRLVAASDPYFTWSDSPLEQYVIMDSPFFKRIGWRPKPGPQVIYFKKPVPITSGDIESLTSTIGPVKPEDVLNSPTNTLFVTGEPCAPPVSDEPSQPPPPKFKLSGVSEAMLYVFFSIAVFFGIIAAVALVVAKDSWAYRIGTNIASWFEKRT